ncbi:hypothetical protein Tco_0215714 [Tanacetum coccineum]
MAQVQEAAQFYTKEDWDTIRAKLEANADLVKEIAGEDVSEADYAQRMRKKSRKRTGEELQTESSKKLKSDTREDVSVPKEKDKESVKKEEEFEIKKPVLRYTKRKSLGRKGLQRKPESAKSGTEEDVEAYIEERIIKTGKRGAYQIIREDNTDVVYVNFQGLLNDLTRDDLKELYRLMMLKYGDNRPEEEFERVLWGDLKTMFDPPSTEDAVWNLTHQQKVLSWRYFHSCVVHCLTLEAAHIYMLTEVKYPLPPRVCKAMLEKKLLGDRKDEISCCKDQNRPSFYKDDDEEYTIAITLVLLTKEPNNSLSMRDEQLSTILKTELDELIKSSVENLVSIPSESEDFFDNESECDVPVCDTFMTFSNLLFDTDDDFSSSDDESFFDKDIPKEIYSNPLFDEEIISTKIDPHHFNAESDLIESFLNRDTLIISSPEFNSLLEEFSGELAHVDLIPQGINETDFDPEEEIRLVEKLLYDNSSPRPPKEFNSKNSDAIIKSFSPSPIRIKDSDSLMEEIDLFLTSDDSIPPGIENDDYDSEGDILFFKELLSNDSPSLPINESFHFDVPSSPLPPAKPPDDDEIEPDTGVLTAKVVGDISELYVHVPNVLTTLPTLSPMFDNFLPFSSKNDDKIFNHGILASNEEKCWDSKFDETK